MRAAMVGGTAVDAGRQAARRSPAAANVPSRPEGPPDGAVAQVQPGRDPGRPTPTGPVQLLVLGVDEPRFADAILPELERLRDLESVRLLDALVVRKRREGGIEAHPLRGLDAVGVSGSLVRGLVGLDHGDGGAGRDEGPAGGRGWYLSDAIPVGVAAAVVLVEHRWAIPLRDASVRAGAASLADEWIHPADLVAAGLAALPRADAGRT